MKDFSEARRAGDWGGHWRADEISPAGRMMCGTQAPVDRRQGPDRTQPDALTPKCRLQAHFFGEGVAGPRQKVSIPQTLDAGGLEIAETLVEVRCHAGSDHDIERSGPRTLESLAVHHDPRHDLQRVAAGRQRRERSAAFRGRARRGAGGIRQLHAVAVDIDGKVIVACNADRLIPAESLSAGDLNDLRREGGRRSGRARTTAGGQGCDCKSPGDRAPPSTRSHETSVTQLSTAREFRLLSADLQHDGAGASPSGRRRSTRRCPGARALQAPEQESPV